jgi:hypothetical protein
MPLANIHAQTPARRCSDANIIDAPPSIKKNKTNIMLSGPTNGHPISPPYSSIRTDT